MHDIKNAVSHLKTHQTYPANREELIKSCEDLKEFSKEDKEWFKEHLPEGTYESAQEVIMALGLDTAKMKSMDQMPTLNV